MKASAFSDAQKAFILKQGADGVPVAEICRRAGISQATYFNWKKKYDGLLPTEMKRLKQLEDENTRLRKLVADLSLDREMLQDMNPAIALRPGRKRELVDGCRGDWGVSIRRACRVLEMDTSSYHYRSCRPDQAGFETRIKAMCQTRVRYGYRRIHVLLQREGWQINIKKTRRIYNELSLQLRNKTPKRRVKASQPVTLTRAGNSSSERSREWEQIRSPKDSRYGWMRNGGHVKGTSGAKSDAANFR